jgi:hypothetical protein
VEEPNNPACFEGFHPRTGLSGRAERTTCPCILQRSPSPIHRGPDRVLWDEDSSQYSRRAACVRAERRTRFGPRHALTPRAWGAAKTCPAGCALASCALGRRSSQLSSGPTFGSVSGFEAAWGLCATRPPRRGISTQEPTISLAAGCRNHVGRICRMLTIWTEHDYSEATRRASGLWKLLTGREVAAGEVERNGTVMQRGGRV